MISRFIYGFEELCESTFGDVAKILNVKNVSHKCIMYS